MNKGNGDSSREIKPRFCSYDDIPLFLDANDIMRLLGLSRTTVYYMLRADDFPAIALGSRRIVKREKLFEWLNKHENASEPSNE